MIKEAAAAVFYTVKQGDTLWEIAEAHYGKGQGVPLGLRVDPRCQHRAHSWIHPGQT